MAIPVNSETSGAGNRGYIGHAEDFHVAGRAGVQGEGAYMLLYLHVVHGHIENPRFATTGCPAANACGRFLMDQLTGMPVSDAKLITREHIVAGLGAMPLGREHFPQLTVDALCDALARAPEPNRAPDLNPTDLNPTENDLH